LHLFHDERFERLAGISNGHLYNLRHSVTYRGCRGTVHLTHPVQVAIGQRRRPEPNGQPGFVRVDTVHQGNQGASRGLYHINLVDELTLFQYVGSVERISERLPFSVRLALLEAFPFTIQGVHADNGPSTSITGLLTCSTTCILASSPSAGLGAATTMP